MSITYLVGDATCPVGTGTRVIVHSCNDVGAWGAGFVLALSKKWPEPRKAYLATPKLRLGDVTFVQVEKDIFVANLVGQRGLIGPKNPMPFSYGAFATGLSSVSEFALKHSATIHMPRVGCGLGGATWSYVEKIILEQLVDLEVFVYDFEEKKR